MNIILTIAIPTYNRDFLLKRAVDSINVQYRDEIEILVSDNASTDKTEMIMKEYANTYPYIRYIRNKENIGSMKNFMQCYRSACGEFVLLLGSDDVLLPGAINTIISFLKKNRSVDWVFLNHSSFQKEYTKENANKSFLKEANNYLVTENKKLFMSYVKHQVTFMSCNILKTSNVLSIENPEQFYYTYFLHTCLTFCSTKNDNAKYGIIFYPSVSQDLTPGHALTDRNPVRAFTVFGKYMKYVLCNLSVECNYNKKQMEHIFIYPSCRTMVYAILLLKIKKVKKKEWIKQFWDYGFLSVYMYRYAWISIVPAFFIPRIIAKVIFKIKMPKVYDEIIKAKKRDKIK